VALSRTIFRLPPFLLLLISALAAGCDASLPTGDSEEPASPQRVSVTRITDGDTVKVRPAIDGIEDVRLIGVDTPEKYGPDGPQPLAEEAAVFTEEGLQRGTWRVELRFDVEKVDQYGRLLAYVYLPDGRMLNEALISGGYAQVATFPPNTKYLERFEAAQEEAQGRDIGIWSLSEDRICELADRGNGIGGGC